MVSLLLVDEIFIWDRNINIIFGVSSNIEVAIYRDDIMLTI